MQFFDWLNRFKRQSGAGEAPPPRPAPASLFEATFEAADVGLAHIGLDGKILRANPVFSALFGFRPEEIVGIDKLALAHPDDREALRADFEALRRGEALNYAAERTYLVRGGGTIQAWSSARLIGDPRVVMLVTEDVTARRAAEHALRKSEERFQLAMKGANEGLYDWGVAEHKTYLSPRWKSMLGYEEHEIADEPESWLPLAAPGVVEAMAEQIRLLEAGEIDTYELQIKLKHKDGRWLDILSRAFPVFDDNHRMVRLVGTHQDITQRKRHEAEIRLSATVFANTPEGIVVADFAGFIEAVNPAFETLTGYSLGDVKGRKIGLLKSGRHDARFYEDLHRDIKTTGRWRGEIWNRRKDGAVVPFWATISVVRDDHGQPSGYIALYSDISDYKRSQSRLDFLAHHDAETALPNRISLKRRIEAAIAAIGLRGGAALFHLDLDRYRAIVESLGHAAGDELLAQTAKRFFSKLGPSDMLARVGVDEFAILKQPCADAEEAKDFAEALLAEMEQPFVFVSGSKAYSGAHIGLAFLATPELDADTALWQAESALYAAKESGSAVRFYEPRHITEARERLDMELGLRRALERDEFVLQFQPLVDLRTRKTFGVEALVRWRGPEGLVPPGRFIPLAEKTGLIVPIGEWVLRRSAERMKAWLDAGYALDVLAINISPRQFERPEICERVAEVLRETGLAFDKVEIEITESVLMSQKDAAAKLAHLRSLGLRIAVDDFGTGHSSLAYLKNFPIDKLKLDRAFIIDVPADSAGMEIASSVIRLGHSLDVEVLAEGVETEAQAEFLARSGCRLAQGFLFGRPMWEEDLLASLRETAAA
jgi:diguanylate cyclase (GGDEF)-like protein/PAS domain S-box-containing protein